MKLICIVPLAFALCALAGCKYLSFSETMTRTAEPKPQTAEPCFLALSNGEICQMGAQQCSNSRAFLDEFKKNPPPSQRDILKENLVQTVIRKEVQSAQACNADLERWALKTMAAGKPAPFDVAGLSIAGLQEIKLVIWAGGMMAGFMGDGVGSACMSIIGAGVSYAESKKWISCRH
ncbi:MAG: hypothetical protein RL189_336 [Pseudomonadota bacterium]|jgi:hypothetical protein